MIASSPALRRFYDFFETYGAERLNGLNESHFDSLTSSEREEVWKFLAKDVAQSEESIKGLYLLNKDRAIEFFKEVVTAPMKASEYSAERKELEVSRLSLLAYINSVEPDEKYVNAMCEFADSEFEDVRGLFARSLPIGQVTPDAVHALEKMIFTEVERVPLASAITKFMAIHGMDFDMDDSLYDSIYRSLRSDDPKEKMAAIRRLKVRSESV